MTRSDARWRGRKTATSSVLTPIHTTIEEIRSQPMIQLNPTNRQAVILEHLLSMADIVDTDASVEVRFDLIKDTLQNESLYQLRKSLVAELDSQVQKSERLEAPNIGSKAIIE